MKNSEIQGHLRDLKREWDYVDGRGLDFEEWLTSQCMELRSERDDLIEKINRMTMQMLQLQIRLKNQDNPNDGKNSSHEHSGGKGGWSV